MRCAFMGLTMAYRLWRYHPEMMLCRVRGTFGLTRVFFAKPWRNRGWRGCSGGEIGKNMEKLRVKAIFFAKRFVNSKIMPTFATQTTKTGHESDANWFARSENCENSSVGRARPCQGRGRGFESRFSLTVSTLT